jgi:hypothetical protein
MESIGRINEETEQESDSASKWAQAREKGSNTKEDQRRYLKLETMNKSKRRVGDS